jgi:hypothetical protein
MAIDPALLEALQAAVNELGQPKPVAQRLAAWLKSLSDGEETEHLDNRFYENLIDELRVPGDDDAD